jgi:hypothetical protein
MPKQITLRIGSIELRGELLDNPAGRAMAQALPFDCDWSRWGEEYYGSTTPSFGRYPGETVEIMEIGDLAYHGENGWFCLFFGPTPASRGDEPRAAVPVQKVGRVDGDWAAVRGLGASVKATVMTS